MRPLPVWLVTWAIVVAVIGVLIEITKWVTHHTLMLGIAAGLMLVMALLLEVGANVVDNIRARLWTRRCLKRFTAGE